MVGLRNFTDGDAEVLREAFYRDMPLEAVGQMIKEWSGLRYRGKYFEMFAVTEGENIVGELSLYEHSKSVVSIGIEILSEFQGQGFGKQAAEIALEICKSKGYKIVCNQVRTDNEQSIALHESLGFESDTYRYKNQKDRYVYLFLKPLA